MNGLKKFNGFGGLINLCNDAAMLYLDEQKSLLDI